MLPAGMWDLLASSMILLNFDTAASMEGKVAVSKSVREVSSSWVKESQSARL